MITIKEIYTGAERLINGYLRQEARAQGHTLTGGMEDSFRSKQTLGSQVNKMEGFAVMYTKFVNDGFPAQSASMRQFPFVKHFFMLRGLDEKNAAAAAAATINIWMREGMPTQAAKRFSETGSRTNFIDNIFVGKQTEIDGYFSNTFDFWMDEQYHKEKSETI